VQAITASAWFWASFAISGCCIAALPLLEERIDESRIRSLARFALEIAPVLIPVVAVLLLAPGLSDDIKGLLIAACFAAYGWFVTNLQASKERAADNDDLLEALRAEIWVQLNDLSRNSHTSTADEVASSSAAQFFSQPGPPVVFEAVAAQISRLPGKVVDEVVQYYSLLATLRQNAAEMRDPVFLARPPRVRQRAYRVYMENLGVLATLAEAAIRAINRALNVPDPDRIDLAGENGAVSRPDRARSGLSASASDANGRLP
jgi:hypothetical protein